MQRQHVISSNLESVGYDPVSRTLEIGFRSGAVYEYFGVPESEYEGLMTATSKGSYFRDHIRDSYQYRQVG